MVDILAAPSDAIAKTPTRALGLLALLIVIALTLIGGILQLGANHHVDSVVLRQQFATTHDYDSYTQAQKDAIAVDTAAPAWWKDAANLAVGVAAALIGTLLSATILFFVGRVFGGVEPPARFAIYWRDALLIAVPAWGIYALAAGLITVLRGPASFDSYADLSVAVPSLALVTPAFTHSSAVTAFAGAMNPFSAWQLYLNALVLMIVGRTTKTVAFCSALGIFVFGAALQAVLTSLL